MIRNITKALFMVSALLILGGLVACEEGSYFDPNTKQIKSDYVSRLEATGTDFRIYEFTPRSAPHIQCVIVAGESKGGLQCWGKGVVNPDYSAVQGLYDEEFSPPIE